MTRMKGLFKGIKNISNIFVYKEHEMQIGHPTDVRHVAHIGWDGSSANSPSWMSEFKTSSDFSSASLSYFGQSRETSWDSQDFEQPRAQNQASEVIREPPCPDVPKAPKKVRRKKAKSASSQSSSRSSKSRASFGTGMDMQEVFPEKIRVS